MVGHPTPIIANLTRIKCHAPEEVGREAIKTSQSSVVWDGPAVSHWTIGATVGITKGCAAWRWW